LKCPPLEVQVFWSQFILKWFQLDLSFASVYATTRFESKSLIHWNHRLIVIQTINGGRSREIQPEGTVASVPDEIWTETQGNIHQMVWSAW
jgi:hypothetical protein